jgi:hypothetical protein
MSGTLPSARSLHGFTSAAGKLFVHGGFYFAGKSLELILFIQRLFDQYSY